ncbi:Sec-independent protein translocase subunit TatA/TatB [Miltoncostaea oceani]|uniref:Sec-independent protein translocase subunit TatA/TatB n=1 Tax=Miltoncostaea oceani TaxID=2843216 RepID=UPI003CCEB90F
MLRTNDRTRLPEWVCRLVPWLSTKLRPRHNRKGISVVNISPVQIMIVVVIALLVFGPSRLPGIARTVGREIRELKGSLTTEQVAESAPVAESPPVADKPGSSDRPQTALGASAQAPARSTETHDALG